MSSLSEKLRRMEEALADPEVRNSVEAMQTILHPDFVEFGASGRIFNRDSIIDLLGKEADDYSTYDIADFTVTSLGDESALVTYTIPAREGGSASRRSSVWVLEGGTWQIRFHQGTRFEE